MLIILFRSVEWFSGNFPEKLQIALSNSSRVISAWDGEKLIGLIRGLDDGIWQATIDCLLVNSEYQGRGIASTLLKYILDDYSDFLYVGVVPDEKRNVAFYEKHGFQVIIIKKAMIQGSYVFRCDEKLTALFYCLKTENCL